MKFLTLVVLVVIAVLLYGWLVDQSVLEWVGNIANLVMGR